MINLLWLVLFMSIGYWVGRATLRVIGVRFDSYVVSATWHISAGWGVIGLLLALMGVSGILYRELIVGLTVVGGLFSLRGLGRSLSLEYYRFFGVTGNSEYCSDWVNRPKLPLSSIIFGIFLGVAAILVALFALLGAMAPPTAGDAMCYHLQLPKVFLSRHSLEYLPYSDNSTYPLLMEMLYLWGLSVSGGTLAQMMHWTMGILFAGATVVLARNFLGKHLAWLTGATALFVPGLTNEMTSPLNDVALALFTTLTTSAFFCALRTRQLRWYLVSGAMFGFSLGVKYLALVFGLALLVPVLFQLLWNVKKALLALKSWRRVDLLGNVFARNKSGKREKDLDAPFPWSDMFGLRVTLFQGVIIGFVVSTVVGGGWYARSFHHTGNPVYPFFVSWFGEGKSDALPERKVPLKPTVSDIMIAPWQLTMFPERFGGRAHQLGPLFLAFLPGCFMIRINSSLARLMIISAVYLTAWYLLRQNVRFLLPIVSMLCVLVIRVFSEVRKIEMLPRALTVGCVSLLAVFSVAVSFHRVRDQAAVVMGMEKKEQYLERTEPSYRIAQYVNTHLPVSALVLSQDYRSFYFHRDIVRENLYRRSTNYHQSKTPIESEKGRVEFSDPQHQDDITADLRVAGFTHVIIAESDGPEVSDFDSTLSQLLEPHNLICEYEHEFRNRFGGIIRYRIFKL